ncbi:MAG: hypothetical protein J4224_02570 [Candidatus Diapherotrites archaeon]|uniref:Uncharacterized protein n=1 Tax=Candidatus Iainarchaeum sp. TaxID=3101447 RepID=A0A7J4ITY0_9ARCH|nr:MAG: hypothetical protein QT03_C0001G1367 [archaeon GW2011_AR10]MBS3059287.1 hypothetical protein [Candidatus Diapherotrites archaeon]HIH07829.1 hypothetical protein [Candidatus Diapherotrites archaeon]
MAVFNETMNEFIRKGAFERVRWMQNLEKTMLPSHIKRIQQNDKTVMQEVVIPRWVTWDLLFEWANKKNTSSGRRCILCANLDENGIDFKERFICENCFLKLKHLE